MQGRIDRLDAFIMRPEFEKLDATDQSDLRQQRVHMEAYLRVLVRRLSRIAVKA